MGELTTDLSSLTSLPSTATAVNLSQFGGESNFLRRLHLYTKGRDIDEGRIAPGHFGIKMSQEEILDVGTTADVVVLAVRYKAVDSNPDPAVVVYDPTTEVYKDIEARAPEQDSGCMYGPSFLCYERDNGFVEVFCGNKSARQEAKAFGQYLPVSEEEAAAHGIEARPPGACTLKAKLIPKKSRSWHALEVGRCSTPFDNLPPVEEIAAEIDKFRNAKSTGPEAAASGSDDR